MVLKEVKLWSYVSQRKWFPVHPQEIFDTNICQYKRKIKINKHTIKPLLWHGNVCSCYRYFLVIFSWIIPVRWMSSGIKGFAWLMAAWTSANFIKTCWNTAFISAARLWSTRWSASGKSSSCSLSTTLIGWATSSSITGICGLQRTNYWKRLVQSDGSVRFIHVKLFDNYLTTFVDMVAYKWFTMVGLPVHLVFLQDFVKTAGNGATAKVQFSFGRPLFLDKTKRRQC